MILKLRDGFTLAEVLITLGIIGVVASMTMPTLIAHYKEKVQITAMKKVYSEISQANQLLNAEYGGNWTNECDDFDNACFRDMFATKLKVLKTCDKPVEEGCQAQSTYLDGNDRDELTNSGINDNWSSLITNSGYSLKFRFHFNGCKPNGVTGDYKWINYACGWMQIDTNGLKGPNIMGKDIFYAELYSDGTLRGRSTKYVLEEEAKTKSQVAMTQDEIEENCKNGTGVTCSALYLTK